MAKGIAINIGLNIIDAVRYGNNGRLPYCANDANEMSVLAFNEGYYIQDFLIDKDATAGNVNIALNKAAEALYGGDKLLLTYSGHGGQHPDQNGDEKDDKYDETWVLYDRKFLDDELYYAWSKFRKGVRIVLVSDSCFSGTVAKPSVTGRNAFLEILQSEAQLHYKRHKEIYDSHAKFLPSSNDLDIQASVILLASSQDNQTSKSRSRSGNKLSLFTDELLTVYSQKDYKLNYKTFIEAIKNRIPSHIQTPNYFQTGIQNEKFINQRPFAI